MASLLTILEAHEIQCPVDTLLQMVSSQSVEPSEKGKVLVSREHFVKRERLRRDSHAGADGWLRRIAGSVDEDFPFIGLDQADEAVDGGGLAGAVRTEQAEDLAALNVKAQPIDGGECAEALLNLSQFERDVVRHSYSPYERG